MWFCFLTWHRYLIENTPGAEKAIFSTHCHNDLGLAVANTLTAVQDGARQVEVTINGIGERAGNASLEEVLMSISVRPNSFPVFHGCDTTELTRLSRSVANFTGIQVPCVACPLGMVVHTTICFLALRLTGGWVLGRSKPIRPLSARTHSLTRLESTRMES